MIWLVADVVWYSINLLQVLLTVSQVIHKATENGCVTEPKFCLVSGTLNKCGNLSFPWPDTSSACNSLLLEIVGFCSQLILTGKISYISLEFFLEWIKCRTFREEEFCSTHWPKDWWVWMKEESTQGSCKTISC